MPNTQFAEHYLPSEKSNVQAKSSIAHIAFFHRWPTEMLIIVCGEKRILKIALCILKLAVISDSEILNKFGERVRQLRKRKDISQEELAHRADLHRTYIGMIERAEKNITLLNIEKIAVALDVSISDLLKV